MSSVYKRKNSRYYWWSAFYKGRKLKKSTKMTQKHLAQKVRQHWDLKLMLDDLTFLGMSNMPPIEVNRYICDYLKFVERRKYQNTFDVTRGVLRKFEEYLKSVKVKLIDEISIKTIDDYIDWLICKPKTKKNHIGVISIMLEKAVKEELIKSNPTKHATLPVIVSKPHRPLEPIDLEIVFEGAGKWFLYYSFLYYTGLRAGDVAILKYGNIDWSKGAIVSLVRKSRRIHEFPLAENLLKQIPRNIDGEMSIFPDLYSENDKQLNSRLAKPRKHLQMLLRLNDRKKADLHSFRATYNNSLRDLGLSIEDRQILLAHSSSETTKIYTHPNYELAKKYVDLIKDYSNKEPKN